MIHQCLKIVLAKGTILVTELHMAKVHVAKEVVNLKEKLEKELKVKARVQTFCPRSWNQQATPGRKFVWCCSSWQHTSCQLMFRINVHTLAGTGAEPMSLCLVTGFS